MKFSIPNKDFVKALSRCIGTVEPKSTLPVLSNIYVEAHENNTVTFRATDLYLAIETTIAADVKATGSACVPAKDTLERTKALPAGDVVVTMADASSAVELRSAIGHRRFRVHGLPGDSFPPIPCNNGDDESKFIVPAKLLAELIFKTSFSISSDVTRPHLNSLLVEGEDGVLRGVSTDGHRLSMASVRCGAPVMSILLPQKAVSELHKLLEGIEGDITMTTKGVIATFVFGFGTFSVKTVNAQFPAYRQVIPEKTDCRANVPRTAMIEALRACSLASSERTGGVALSFEQGTLKITSESADRGEGADEIPADYEGEATRIGCNAKYLIDALSVLDSEEADIGFGAALAPITVSPVGADGFVAVVMPMKLD